MDGRMAGVGQVAHGRGWEDEPANEPWATCGAGWQAGSLPGPPLRLASRRATTQAGVCWAVLSMSRPNAKSACATDPHMSRQSPLPLGLLPAVCRPSCPAPSSRLDVGPPAVRVDVCVQK